MFLHPLALLALLGVPAVVLLHWLRRRHRARRVSALFLWREDAPPSASGPRLERFRATPSFWLEVAAAASLALALGSPRGCGPERAEHLVCVLDDTASMGASTLADEARTRLAARIRALPASSRVTLVRSGNPPRMLCGPAGFPSEALDALAAWAPEAAGHGLEAALALALEVAGGGPVVFVTDCAPERELPEAVELVALGTPLENLAITHAARTRSGADVERVLVTVSSFADRSREAELTVWESGRVLERRRAALEPAARASLAFDVPRGTGELELALAPDDLAIDDHAFLAPPAHRPIALGTTLTLEECEALGLAAEGSPIARWLALVEDGVAAVDAEHADLVLSRTPVAGERTWCLSIEGFESSESVVRLGPLLVERRHPLLEGTSFQGVVWAADPDLALPDTPLVSSERGPLLTERIGAGRRVYRMNLDPRRSSLQRSSDWPILLANLAELRARELDGPGRTSLFVGEPLVLRGLGRGTVTLRRARGIPGSPEPAPREFEVEGLFEADAPGPGFWSILRDGRELARYGVTFADANESDLRGCASVERPARSSSAALAETESPLETLFLALGLAAALGDAWFLARAGARRI